MREALREGATIGAANLAEVVGKLVGKGKDPVRIVARLMALGLEVLEAGALDPLARPLGFSLGDRACLVTGTVHGLPVLTADRTWVGAVPGVEVRVIR